MLFHLLITLAKFALNRQRPSFEDSFPQIFAENGMFFPIAKLIQNAFSTTKIWR